MTFNNKPFELAHSSASAEEKKQLAAFMDETFDEKRGMDDLDEVDMNTVFVLPPTTPLSDETRNRLFAMIAD